MIPCPDGNGSNVVKNMSRTSSSALTNPLDVKVVSLHFFEDLSCFG